MTEKYGIVVASHGVFCEELIRSAQMIFGELPDVASVALKGDMSPEAFGEQLRTACKAFDDRVIVLCDIFSGTPFRMAAMLSQEIPDMILLTGVNMPMLINAAELRDCTAPEKLAEQIVEESKESIVDVMKALNEN